MDGEDERRENGEDAEEDVRDDDDGEGVRAWSGLTVGFAFERKKY